VKIIILPSKKGPKWKKNTGWATDAPLGNWHGVKVNPQGNVIEIRLQVNGLTVRIFLYCCQSVEARSIKDFIGPSAFEHWQLQRNQNTLSFVRILQ
jgi:hypothetical protein